MQLHIIRFNGKTLMPNEMKECAFHTLFIITNHGCLQKTLVSYIYVQCIQSLLSSTVFEASWLFPKNIFKRGSMGPTTICADHIWSIFPENGHQVQPWVARRRWRRWRVKIIQIQRTCKSQKQQTWLKVSMIFLSPIKMQISTEYLHIAVLGFKLNLVKVDVGLRHTVS